jgi:hypothetical protein
LIDDAVKLGVHVGEAGEVALVDNGGCKARLGKDHHPGGRLDEMGAGTRADDKEEGVLDFAVKPDDAGQATEHFALAALAQDRQVGAPRGGGDRRAEGRGVVHRASSRPADTP